MLSWNQLFIKGMYIKKISDRSSSWYVSHVSSNASCMKSGLKTPVLRRNIIHSLAYPHTMLIKTSGLTASRADNFFINKNERTGARTLDVCSRLRHSVPRRIHRVYRFDFSSESVYSPGAGAVSIAPAEILLCATRSVSYKLFHNTQRAWTTSYKAILLERNF